MSDRVAGGFLRKKVRLLYFTRNWTGHDERFVGGFLDRGIELGIVVLQALAAPKVAAYSRGKVDFVRSLGLEGLLDDSTAGAVAKEYLKLEKEFVPDVVLAGPLSDCAYLKTLAVSAVPFVAQSWAFDVFWESEQSAEALQHVMKVLNRCSGLFTDCKAVVERCEQIVAHKIPHCFTMPWGLDFQEMRQSRNRQALRIKLGIAERKVLLHTRGLEPIYGVKMLLEAFCDLHESDPTTLLMLASDGSMRREVEHVIASHSLSKGIWLLGHIPHTHVLDLFVIADAYVSCAACDGTSISLLEAMALGVPPVVPDVGGNAEWICNADRGWVVRPGDRDHLKAAMACAVNLEGLTRERLLMRNRKTVEAKADWVTNFPHFQQFLKQTAKQV